MTIEVSDYGDSVVITQTEGAVTSSVKIDYETAKLVAKYIELVTKEDTLEGLIPVSMLADGLKTTFAFEDRIRNSGRG